MRLDKYLWCVRIFKTRSLATDACKSGKIILNGKEAKPAIDCKKEDTFIFKAGPLKFEYKIIDFPSSRINAKLVSDYLIEITSEENKKRNQLILESRKENAFYEFGKPTKKDRRSIDKFKSDWT